MRQPAHAALVVTALGIVARAVGAAPGSPPNIVLIVTDDQGWTSTSVQLDPAMPDSASDFYQTVRLEALAAQGMRFSNAYASAPSCSPTRAAIQTGKSPAQLQMTDIVNGGDLANPEDRFLDLYVGETLSPPLPRTRLPLEEVTIAERIKQANPDYVAAHFGKWHLGLDGSSADALLQGYDAYGLGPPVPGENPKDIDRLTNVVNLFLEQQAATGRPFFLQISHYAPHAPIEARQATLEAYQAMPGGVRHDASDAAFAAMIHDLDAGIGTTLDKLVELGLDADTYVFFVSDNGGRTDQGYGNNLPLKDSKGSIHEGGLRVPMIVRGPGIAPGSHCGLPVVTHDLFTTITALAGATAPLPEGVEGADLRPVLFNGGVLPPGADAIARPHAPNGELFFHLPHYGNGGPYAPWRVTPASAVRDGDFKLIRKDATDGDPEQTFLFNLAQSVAESPNPAHALNLADDLPEVVAELSAKLEAWLDAVDASHAYDVAQAVELTWDAAPRSVEDVNYLFREQWDLDEGAPPAIVPAATPPGLPDLAYRFDGGQRMTRKFFHVSEIALPDELDNDHSASFEFWLEADGLDAEQVLFESGDGTAGLSITLGDGAARLRILGNDGNALTLTSPLDAGVTQGFAQLVAVFSDDPADRYAEMFLNGASLGRVQGVNGVDEIDWDLLDPASLGLAEGAGVGGNGGPGALPFAGGGFRGEIARFRFSNTAVDGAEVASRYDEIRNSCFEDCVGDDGVIGIDEFLAVLSQWGTAGPCDLDGGGAGLTDLLTVLGLWGPCP